MSRIQPSSHGIVVEHKENGVRYAVSDKNYNPSVHRKVRDLRPGESVLSYKPKRRRSSQASSEDVEATQASGEGDKDAESATRTLEGTSSEKTEGSAPAGTKDAITERN